VKYILPQYRYYFPDTHIYSRNANASVSCPVEPGPYTIVQSVELPKEVPKRKFIAHILKYDFI
jgi:hypothetical protein